MISRLVYIAGRIEPVRTGGEQYNLHLIQAAERAGIRVVRLALTDSPIYLWLTGATAVWRLSRPYAWLWLHAKLWRYRHDMLLFDAWLAPLLWPGVELLRRHYLVMVHHLFGEFRERGLRWIRVGFCESRLLRGAVRVLTVSRSSRRQVERRVRHVAIDIINPAFEPVGGLTTGGGDVLRILYVGHVTHAKGVLDLARAMAGLARDKRWRLELVGRDSVEPDTTRQFRDICRQEGIGDRVEIHGRLDDAALLDLYLSSDIFVLPSHWEGYGIVLLEAMSHRLAVVSTTAGAIPEVVSDGTTGLLVPAGDVEALRAALQALIDDAELRDRLARQGMDFARKHADWKDMEDACVQWWCMVTRG